MEKEIKRLLRCFKRTELSEQDITDAIIKYADQEKEKEAVAFAEWLEFNGWRACYMVNHWDNIFTKLDYPKPTTELYKIYKK